MQVLDVWYIVCFARGTLGEAQRCCGRLTGWGRHIYDPTENYILKTLTRMRFFSAFAVVTMRSDKQTILTTESFCFKKTFFFCFYFKKDNAFRTGICKLSYQDIPLFTHNISFITIYCKQKIHCTIDFFQYLLTELFFSKLNFFYYYTRKTGLNRILSQETTGSNKIL